MNKVKVAPSILAADFGSLAQQLKLVEEAGADLIHIDVMDGHFVPNITLGPAVVASIRKVTQLPFDVHLMIENPLQFAKSFLEAGADILTFHIEAIKDKSKIISLIKSYKKKVGVSLNPKTPLESLKGLLDKVDMVLLMTVNPGFGGQTFMRGVLPKIRDLRAIFGGDIEVDGGIDFQTAGEAVQAGANILVAGTYVFKNDAKEAIRRLKGND